MFSTSRLTRGIKTTTPYSTILHPVTKRNFHHFRGISQHSFRKSQLRRWKTGTQSCHTQQQRNASSSPPNFQPKAAFEGSINGGTPINVAQGTRLIQVEDKKNGKWTRFDAAALRDSCTCAVCEDRSSGQKNFATTDVPLDIEIDRVRLTNDGLGVSFRNDIKQLAVDGHETVVSWDKIEKALGHQPLKKPIFPRQDAIYPKTGRKFWNAETIQSRVRKIDYHEFMKGEEAFWQTLLDLGSLGLVFLKNVPHDQESITSITTRIANIKSTFYGRTFDVRAKPDAENVAYTSGYLGLHQDLLYLESPPAIQLLHCLENSCAGGESLFSDGLRAGKLLWLQRPREAVENLARVRVPYHYEKHGYFYQQTRPLFSVTEEDVLASVYWSPPFQDRFQLPTVDMRPWLAPARLFDTLINDDEAMFQMKMAPGECVLFDNLRVMHGRRAFDAAGGSRWLRGAYIAREDITSRILHVPEDMAREYRKGEVWTRETEDEALRRSTRYGEVTERLEKVVSELRALESSMDAIDHQRLNGEVL